MRKYKLLQRQMKAYGEERGLKMLAQFDLDVLSKFRATWKDGPRTAGKKLERLRAFFRFAHDRQWVEINPATRIKLPKVSIRPTMPLTHDEMVKILTACDGLQITTPIEGKLNAHRLKTLVVLMRYTGMRVSDAVTLTTDRLDGKRLFLYTQKTGEPVYTVLPDSVLSALEATPRITDTRYFWSGQGKRETVICHWQMRLKKVFDLAKVSKGEGNAISHRSVTRLQWSSSSSACRSSASRFCLAIKACASQNGITTHGCVHGRSSLRPMLPVRGRSIRF